MENEKVFALFSGGKDSLAALLKAIEVYGPRNVVAVYIEVTGNTHEMNKEFVYSVIDRLGIDFIHMKQTKYEFFNALEKWGIPHFKNRWCTTVFKLSVMKKIFREGDLVITGLRSEDSIRRRQKYSVFYQDETTKTLSHNIIFDWTEKQVVKYIRKRGFELSNEYLIFGSSLNCVFCPFRTRSQATRICALLDEKWRNKIVSALSKIRKDYSNVKKTWLTACKQSLLLDFLYYYK